MTQALYNLFPSSRSKDQALLNHTFAHIDTGFMLEGCQTSCGPVMREDSHPQVLSCIAEFLGVCGLKCTSLRHCSAPSGLLRASAPKTLGSCSWGAPAPAARPTSGRHLVHVIFSCPYIRAAID